MTIDAPLYGDPRPPQAPGRVDQLWEFEVVELFLLGEDSGYLELEFGPWGHYLALVLSGPRQVTRDDAQIGFSVSRGARRWTGHAVVERALLPAGLWAANAFAIHGVGAERTYAAAYPSSGDRPDFHRLDSFRPINWTRSG